MDDAPYTDADLIGMAMREGKLDVLRWLSDKCRYRLDVDIFVDAVGACCDLGHNKVAMIDLLLFRGCPWDIRAMAEAVNRERMDVAAHLVMVLDTSTLFGWLVKRCTKKNGFHASVVKDVFRRAMKRDGENYLAGGAAMVPDLVDIVVAHAPKSGKGSLVEWMHREKGVYDYINRYNAMTDE